MATDSPVNSNTQNQDAAKLQEKEDAKKKLEALDFIKLKTNNFSNGQNVSKSDREEIKAKLKGTGLLTETEYLDKLFDENGNFNNNIYDDGSGDVGITADTILMYQYDEYKKRAASDTILPTTDWSSFLAGDQILTNPTPRDIANAAKYNADNKTGDEIGKWQLVSDPTTGNKVLVLPKTEDEWDKVYANQGKVNIATVTSASANIQHDNDSGYVRADTSDKYVEELAASKGIPKTISVEEEYTDPESGKSGTIQVSRTNPEYARLNDPTFIESCFRSSALVDSYDKIPEGSYYINDNNNYRLIKDGQLTESQKSKLIEAANDPKITTFGYKPKSTPDPTNLSGQQNEQLKPELKKPEGVAPEIVPKYDTSDGGDLIIANHRVAYVRANGTTKIKYPITDQYVDIMGLPPIGVTRLTQAPGDKIIPLYATAPADADSYTNDANYYRYYDQLKASFPVLKIHPIDVEILKEGVRTKEGEKLRGDATSDQKNYRGHVISEVEYRFAVQTSSAIQYTHTNQFGESGVENSLKKIANTFSAMSQAQNLLNAVGGVNSDLFKKFAAATSSLGSKLKNEVGDWQKAAMNSDIAQQHPEIMGMFNGLFNAGMDIMSGGRIDIPDVWLDSSTSNSHTFNIELRTLSADPRSDQYFADILLPLYVLLTLALPTEGQTFIYNTPTYITASLDDSFWEVKFGAVTSLNWSVDTTYINFKKVPTHITVQLTIQDMYKLMPQGVFDMGNEAHTAGHNSDMMTKDDYINNFVRNFPSNDDGSPGLDKLAPPNQAYYLTEYSALAGYQKALDRYNAKEKDKRDKAMQDASLNANGWHYPSLMNKLWTLNINGDQLGTDSPLPDGVDKSARLDKGTNSFATAIGNVITGVTKGIKNITAGVNSAIAPVRELINKGTTVLNTVNDLKASVKTIGKATNIDGILNGEFTQAIGVAFDNLGNAGYVLSDLSNGALTNSKAGKEILNGFSNIARKVISFDLPTTVSEDGNSCNLVDQLKVGLSTVRAVGNTAKVLMNTAAAANGVARSSASNPLERLANYADAVATLADGSDYADKLWLATKQSAIDHKCYGAGQMASNAKLQEKMRQSVNNIAEDAAALTKKIANEGVTDYLNRQSWFKDNVKLQRDGIGTSLKEYSYTFNDPSKASLLDDKFDAAWTAIANGTAKFSEVGGNVVKDATMSGIANTSGAPSAVTISSN